jgi:hypothetical protein
MREHASVALGMHRGDSLIIPPAIEAKGTAKNAKFWNGWKSDET